MDQKRRTSISGIKAMVQGGDTMNKQLVHEHASLRTATWTKRKQFQTFSHTPHGKTEMREQLPKMAYFW